MPLVAPLEFIRKQTQQNRPYPLTGASKVGSTAQASTLPAQTVGTAPARTTQTPLTNLDATHDELELLKVVVVTFGTRTLQRKLPHSEAAKEMKNTLWGPGTNGRTRWSKLPQGLLHQCMMDYWCSGRGDDVPKAAKRSLQTFFVDCRCLTIPAACGNHVGLHAKLQVQYQHQSGATSIYSQCHYAYMQLTAQISRSSTSPPVMIIGFVCNAGEHRSVAMAEVFRSCTRRSTSASRVGGRDSAWVALSVARLPRDRIITQAPSEW